MKRIILTACIFACSIYYASSQTKIGLVFNYSKGVSTKKNFQVGDRRSILLYELVYKGQEDVLSLGISSKTELDVFFLKTDVLYRKTSFLFDLSNYTESGVFLNQEYKNDYHMFHIPVAAGVNIQDFYIGVGPILNLIIDSSKHQDLEKVFSINEKTKHFGFQFLLGYNITNFLNIEIKYENTFTSVTDGFYHEGQRVHIKTSPNLLTFSTGFHF